MLKTTQQHLCQSQHTINTLSIFGFKSSLKWSMWVACARVGGGSRTTGAHSRQKLHHRQVPFVWGKPQGTASVLVLLIHVAGCEQQLAHNAHVAAMRRRSQERKWFSILCTQDHNQRKKKNRQKIIRKENYLPIGGVWRGILQADLCVGKIVKKFWDGQKIFEGKRKVCMRDESLLRSVSDLRCDTIALPSADSKHSCNTTWWPSKQAQSITANVPVVTPFFPRKIFFNVGLYPTKERWIYERENRGLPTWSNRNFKLFRAGAELR